MTASPDAAGMGYETPLVNATQPRRGHFAVFASLLVVAAFAGVSYYTAGAPVAITAANKGWFGGEAAPVAAAAPVVAATPAPAAAAAKAAGAAAPAAGGAAPAAGAVGKVDAAMTPEIITKKTEMETLKASYGAMVPHSEEYNKARAHYLELKAALDPLISARKAEIAAANDEKKKAAQAKIAERDAAYASRESTRATFGAGHQSNATTTPVAADAAAAPAADAAAAPAADAAPAGL